MPVFLTWVKGKSGKKNAHPFKNGILYLKGGDLSEELAGIKYPYKEFPIANFYKEAFFETKKVVYVQLVP
jgi:16S rRNA (guanine527-N7)-methyltransferase